MAELYHWEPSSQNGATIPAFQDGYFSAPCGGEMVYNVLQDLSGSYPVGEHAPANGPHSAWFPEAISAQECFGYHHL